jgi:NitT/TauT family transport system permease protein
MKKTILPLTFALLVLVIWQALTSVFRIPEFLLPSPLRILDQVKLDYGDLFNQGFVTLVEALLGLLVAVATGFLLGAAFALSGTLERMVLPYAVASQAIPIIATAPLLILWLGSGMASKVAMAALICFFPMVVNSTRGLRAASNEQLALMRVFGATVWQTFWKLRLPTSLVYVLSGMRVSAALAMIGAIVAEYAGADRGLGYVITQATYRLDTPRLFAGILYSALGGWLLFLAVAFVERVALARYRDDLGSGASGRRLT